MNMVEAKTLQPGDRVLFTPGPLLDGWVVEVLDDCVIVLYRGDEAPLATPPECLAARAAPDG
jgi:hypothetical protein